MYISRAQVLGIRYYNTLLWNSVQNLWMWSREPSAGWFFIQFYNIFRKISAQASHTWQCFHILHWWMVFIDIITRLGLFDWFISYSSFCEKLVRYYKILLFYCKEGRFINRKTFILVEGPNHGGCFSTLAWNYFHVYHLLHFSYLYSSLVIKDCLMLTW